MSKTFKTRPSWVKLQEPSDVRKERHNHTKGECDLALPTASNWRVPFRGGYYCYYTVNWYGYNNGFYGRGAARWLKAETRLRHGAARARLRRDKHEMLKLDREDMLDFDIVNPHDRHSATWDWM